MKNSNDTMGNRTRDLPACSAVFQPTAPPRGPTSAVVRVNCMKICRVGGVSSRKAFSNVHLIHVSGIQTFYFPALEEMRFVFAARHSSINLLAPEFYI